MENTMATGPVSKTWIEKKKKLKEQFTELTNADLNFLKGKRNEMLDRVRIKLGKTKEEMSAIISGL
jgi:uncharacterized protein YjbJ (UPF0337 family)